MLKPAAMAVSQQEARFVEDRTTRTASRTLCFKPATNTLTTQTQRFDEAGVDTQKMKTHLAYMQNAIDWWLNCRLFQKENSSGDPRKH